jgi:hypothetical protein
MLGRLEVLRNKIKFTRLVDLNNVHTDLPRVVLSLGSNWSVW